MHLALITKEAEAEPPPQFSAHGYCGPTAGWMKMALGMEVGLGPVHIVLDVDTGPLPKTGGSPPNFQAHLYCDQTAGCIMLPLGTEVGLGTRHCVRCGPSYPQKKGTCTPSNFCPMFVVTKWLDG